MPPIIEEAPVARVPFYVIHECIHLSYFPPVLSICLCTRGIGPIYLARHRHVSVSTHNRAQKLCTESHTGRS